MARNYNQTKKYIVSFNTERFKTARWEFQMCKHPTQYGNGSSVAIFINGEFCGMCDTRYDSKIMKDFGKWCRDYFSVNLNPAYEPRIAELEREDCR